MKREEGGKSGERREEMEDKRTRKDPGSPVYIIVRKAYFETSMILYDTISYFIIHPLFPTLDCSYRQNRGNFWNQHEISTLDDASHSMWSFE